MDVVIVAAGSGSRIGGEIPKQYMLIGDKPVIYYSLCTFEQVHCVNAVYVVIAREAETLYRSIYDKYLYGCSKLVREPLFGGSRRQDSVFQALSHIHKNGGTDLIAIHDAARPFISGKLIEDLAQYAASCGGAAPGIPMVDTVKEIDENGIITAHPVRGRLRGIQTPQVFRFAELYNAYVHGAEKEATDDTELFALNGGAVKMIEGSDELFKITYTNDLTRAEKMVREQRERWNC